MKKIINAILIICILLLLAGCKAKTIYVPVESVIKEKEYVDRWQRDSIHLHDSIYVEHKGDTIWMQKYKTFYKEKLVRDSIFITDSVRVAIPYPVVEIKEVNRLSTWQIILICLGGGLIGVVGYRVVRFFGR